MSRLRRAFQVLRVGYITVCIVLMSIENSMVYPAPRYTNAIEADAMGRSLGGAVCIDIAAPVADAASIRADAGSVSHDSVSTEIAILATQIGVRSNRIRTEPQSQELLLVWHLGESVRYSIVECLSELANRIHRPRSALQ